MIEGLAVPFRVLAFSNVDNCHPTKEEGLLMLAGKIFD